MTIENSERIQPEVLPEYQTVLQQIVDDVVQRLGCLGALMTTLEQGNALAMRAYAFNLPPDQLARLVAEVAIFQNGPQSVVYLDQTPYQNNISVSAVNGVNGRPQTYLISNQLHDLLRPHMSKKQAQSFQEEFEIRQMVAIPFFLDDEIVGNLVAISQTSFSERDIDFLVAFGRQAASAIQSQRHLTISQLLERIILLLQTEMQDETQLLQAIVDGVVHDLGYAGAMVATLENGNALPVRAYALDDPPDILSKIEEKVGLKILSPHSVVYLNDDSYRDNLSVRAVKGENGRPQPILESDQLFDLLRPIVNKPLADFAQRGFGIKKVVAVPFFRDDEVIGNLFVATRRSFLSNWEKRTLITLAQHAAVGVQNARLYRQTKEQRQIAEMFGRMAFSATASVHSLSNHVSAIRAYVHLLTMMPNLPEAKRQEVLANSSNMLERLQRVANTLNSLHEPWQTTPDQPVDLITCLFHALLEVFPETSMSRKDTIVKTADGVELRFDISADTGMIYTAPEMLTEALRIILRNGADALAEEPQTGRLSIEVEKIAPARLKIAIRDNGAGISANNLRHIFEMGWSTKQGKGGMGFGLFWAKDYVEGLGGQISVESQLKQGSTFTLLLPICQV